MIWRSPLLWSFGLLSLDQEEPFGRVECSFPWTPMEVWVQHWTAKIQVLFSDIESVLVNGSVCAPFRIIQTVLWGCALSRMLYALSPAPLNMLI